MGRLDQIYSHMPVKIQNFMVSTYGIYWRWLRFGGNFQHRTETYRDREQFSNEQWYVYQKEELKKLLMIAIEHTPYYCDTWSADTKKKARYGILTDLPLLNKEDIREKPRQFVCDNHHPLIKKTFLTSGSTGTPISTYWTVQEIRDSLAVREVRSANWAGVSFTDSSGNLLWTYG